MPSLLSTQGSEHRGLQWIALPKLWREASQLKFLRAGSLTPLGYGVASKGNLYKVVTRVKCLVWTRYYSGCTAYIHSFNRLVGAQMLSNLLEV